MKSARVHRIENHHPELLRPLVRASSGVTGSDLSPVAQRGPAGWGQSPSSSRGASVGAQNQPPRPHFSEQETMGAFQGVPSAPVTPVLIPVGAYPASRQGCVRFVGTTPQPALGTADKAVVENHPPFSSSGLSHLHGLLQEAPYGIFHWLGG